MPIYTSRPSAAPRVAASPPELSSSSRSSLKPSTAMKSPGSAMRCFAAIGIVIEPVTVEHAHLARQAFLDFGKGRHPAGLNFGDCFA